MNNILEYIEKKLTWINEFQKKTLWYITSRFVFRQNRYVYCIKIEIVRPYSRFF